MQEWATAEASPDPAIAAFVARSALIASGAAARFEHLPGGVSSDIWLVRAGSTSFGVKWARSRLGSLRIGGLRVERNVRAARALLANPPDRLAEIRGAWASA